MPSCFASGASHCSLRSPTWYHTGPNPLEGGVIIPYPVAQVLVTFLAVYLVAGVVFAVAFAWKGASAVDSAARGATVGFRILITPGVVVLWPALLMQWRRARRGLS